MLGLGDLDEFMDAATVAIKAAQYENNAMLKGKPIAEPKAWEDLINHYMEHIKPIQERTFKDKIPEENQKVFSEHIKVTEMLMWDKAKKNPMFRNKLMAIDYFPIFFTIPQEDQQFVNQLALQGATK